MSPRHSRFRSPHGGQSASGAVPLVAWRTAAGFSRPCPRSGLLSFRTVPKRLNQWVGYAQYPPYVRPHSEGHRLERSGWLRTAVLGADDGPVSTEALLVGVVASGASRNAILTAGVGAVSAGAMAMGIGEYVSVSAQADTETADRRREEAELAADPESELSELTSNCERRGLPLELASEVAAALQEADPLGAYLRDGIRRLRQIRVVPQLGWDPPSRLNSRREPCCAPGRCCGQGTRVGWLPDGSTRRCASSPPYGTDPRARHARTCTIKVSA